MTETESIVVFSGNEIISYEINVAQIKAMGEQYASLVCVDNRTREECGTARKLIKTTRTGVEKRRKSLKASALEYERRVDEAAALLTAAIAPIEADLDLKIKAYDDAKSAEKAAREAAEKAEFERIAREAAEAEAAKVREAQEAEAKRLAAISAELEAQRVAQEAVRIANEKALADAKAKAEAEAAAKREVEEAAAKERARLSAEAQAKIDAENARKAAALKAEADRLAAERKALDDARIAQERADAARVAAEQAKVEAAAQAERDRLASVEEARLEAIRQAEAAARIEALKPDRQKLLDFARKLDAIKILELHLSSKEAMDVAVRVTKLLDDALDLLEGFGQC